MKFRRILKLIFETDFSIAWISPEGKYIPYEGGNHKTSFWSFKKKQKENIKLNNREYVKVYNILGDFGFNWNRSHKLTELQKIHIKEIATDYFKHKYNNKCYIETLDDNDNVIYSKYFDNIEDLIDFINIL